MDTSDLIRQRRNRVEANSYNGKKAIMPANKHTQRSWDQQMNINIGGKRVEFNKTVVLPNCGGPSCTNDINE